MLKTVVRNEATACYELNQNMLLVSSWNIALNLLLISISGNGTWIQLEDGRLDGKISFYLFIFFCK